MKMLTRIVFFVLACLSVSAHAAPLTVVASFSILGDWVREIGGDRVQVVVLVGPDQDLHAWQPSPAVARQFAGARVVVLNGLGLDDRIRKLALSGGFRGEIVTATQGIVPLSAEGDAHGHHDHGHEDEAGAADPHAWQDIALAPRYVDTIAAALGRADPQGAAVYQQRAARYKQRLAELHQWAVTRFASLKPAQRRAIISHDAFAYFGRRFGLTLIPVQGRNGESQTSARQIAALIRQIRETRLKAVFLENINNGRLTRQLAAETGVAPGGALYSDALSPTGGPAATYLDFYRHNVDVMVAGMSRN